MNKPIKPTLIIDKHKVAANIGAMVRKTTDKGVRFRPHFKTHQSAEIGEMFKQQGIDAIAVSSVEMAEYFANHGWNDITVAILVNRLEIDAINALAGKINLHLLADTPETVHFLAQRMQHHANIWIKIDTGYHRTGLEIHQHDEILKTARTALEAPNLTFKGLLTHSGHSYHATTRAELPKLHHHTVAQMQKVRALLEENGIDDVEISIGDTPTNSVVDAFDGVDEIRCGNFVYYDVMQAALGSCTTDQIAVAVACPVIGVYPARNEIVVYGGAVHLSKETIQWQRSAMEPGDKIYGLVALPNETAPNNDEKTTPPWKECLENTFVRSLSQEHGIIKTNNPILSTIQPGDILMVLPVHSCLAANLLK